MEWWCRRRVEDWRRSSCADEPEESRDLRSCEKLMKISRAEVMLPCGSEVEVEVRYSRSARHSM